MPPRDLGRAVRRYLARGAAARHAERRFGRGRPARHAGSPRLLVRGRPPRLVSLVIGSLAAAIIITVLVITVVSGGKTMEHASALEPTPGPGAVPAAPLVTPAAPQPAPVPAAPATPPTSVTAPAQAATPLVSPTPPPPPPPSTPPPAPACQPVDGDGDCFEPGDFCPRGDHGMSGVAGDGEAIVCVREGEGWRWEAAS